MPRTSTAILTTLVLLGLASATLAEDEPLSVEGNLPMAATEQRRIRALVARLADLDEWQDGISTGGFGGCSFAPLEDELPADATPADHAFRELVALGPDAMPFLLEHLDDPTLTKLVAENGSGHLGSELESNPTSPDEIAAIRSAIPDHATKDESELPNFGLHIEKHAVTVGDACFAILGRITNRTYEAARYQPTFCFVVNSPTRTARLARAVRAQWAGKDLRRELARRLQHDFRTPPTGDWRACGRLQLGALLRLAWYYRTEATPLLMAYLERLDAKKLAARTDPANGVEFWLLIDYLAKLDRPAIRAALAPLVWKTTDRDIVSSLFDLVPNDRSPELLEHIKATMAANVRKRLRSSYRWFFREIRRRWPDRVEETLLWHLRKHQYPAIRDVVETGYIEGITVPVSTWATLLGMTQKAVSWTQGAEPHPIERLRVCDVAAVEIVKQRPDLSFDEQADEKARDTAILDMRKALEKEGIR